MVDLITLDRHFGLGAMRGDDPSDLREMQTFTYIPARFDLINETWTFLVVKSGGTVETTTAVRIK